MKRLILLGLILLFFFSLGCVGETDVCKENMKKCNEECGEGIFAGFCKEGCTSEYNECKKNN